MKTTTIKIEGQIISPEVFEKLDSGEITGQSQKDFGLNPNVKVKDEIARAWADIKDQWNIFKRRRDKIPDTESGTTETRKFWMVPFFEYIGYDLKIASAEIHNGNSYAISHRDDKLDGFPVHIIGCNNSLNRRTESGGTRLSAHALMQEYLNVTEHLFGIATNGLYLRLLRDSGKLVKLAFLEFDLDKMLEEDQYAEFAMLFRLLHSSRMPAKQGEGELCILEKYHQDAIESGSRIRDGLSRAVENSILSFANGFLLHPDNLRIKELIKSGELKPDEYFKNLMRLIYRILFLMVIEERNIVYPNNNRELLKFRDIYYKYYSIGRIRYLAEKRFFVDQNQNDLWISLKNSFRLFEEETVAKKLGLSPLSGELFGTDALGILSECSLGNEILLECLRNLSIFENPATKHITRVNYAALNVEEFGSVYEGLLEYSPVFKINHKVTFSFEKGKERSSSGTHYTPDELVHPLIKHSLDYIIEDKLKHPPKSNQDDKAILPLSHCEERSDEATLLPLSNRLLQPNESGFAMTSPESNWKEQAILSIKVCDVACGSGHILLAAARKMAMALATIRTGEPEPDPDAYRQAIRDVIAHCIYGVDKNPLAVELCKVALWLESHNPNMPLSFLDHRIKCGDSIVGLGRIEELQNGISTEAFKKLPGDDPEITRMFAKRNKEEINNRTQIKTSDTEELINNLNILSHDFLEFDTLPDKTIKDIKNKEAKFNSLKGHIWFKMKEAADIQVSQFFIPKTNENKNKLTTDAEYFRILGNKGQNLGQNVTYPKAISVEKRFFHWFLEFPEVFSKGGFDCILGNPPFLGGQKLSGTFGDNYLECIKNSFTPIGSVELVTYFFRRIFGIIGKGGFQSLISTNTIAQGNSRKDGLDIIMNKGGVINHAVKSIKWPGKAAVEVSLVTIIKQVWKGKYFLNGKEVNTITPYLDDSVTLGNPFRLKQNEGKSFQGSIVLGKGFLLEPHEAKALIIKNPKNKEVLFPFLNGEELNNNPDHKPSRWVVNFFDWDINKCENEYPEIYQILKKNVKPERQKLNDSNYVNRKRKQNWWLYGSDAKSLYNSIKEVNQILAIALTSKTVALSFVPSNYVFSHAIGVFAFDEYHYFSILQSSLHESWARKYASTLETRLRYLIEYCFETFPFPQNISKEMENKLEKVGEKYHEHRKLLMLKMKLGLTKTYNLFHTKDLTIEKIMKGSKQDDKTSEESFKDIIKLRELHKEMDESVLRAYEWTDLNLAHDFYEVDYLPENDRIRYTISPEARKEILKRLLELNHKIHKEEDAMGLVKEKGKAKKGKDEESGKLF